MYATHAAPLSVNASFGVGDAPFDTPCPEAVARNLLWRMPSHQVLALDPQNLPDDLSFQLGDVTPAEKIDLIVEAQSRALVQQVAEKAVEGDGHVRYFESEEQATQAAIDSAAELGIELTPSLMARAADTILCTIPF